MTQAARCAPSIIFLDELDGLVPARSSNSSGGDQVFASVVSTLLALMDGVVDRGAVVVIGATNRCDGLLSSLMLNAVKYMISSSFLLPNRHRSVIGK